MFDADRLMRVSSAYPKPAGFYAAYGTAGFRARADLLTSTVFRCGLLAAARALQLNAHTGIMITASHNPVDDNGVKMVDADGGMIPQSLERMAAELANCQDDNGVVEVLHSLLAETQDRDSLRQDLTVFVGYDTRPSAQRLEEAVLAGIQALGVNANSMGCVTTPQLHFLTFAANYGVGAAGPTPTPQLQTYFDTIVGAFCQLTGSDGSGAGPAGGTLYVDCANGVGALHLRNLVPALGNIGVELQLRNAGTGTLNYQCGADFVQKDRYLPTGFGDVPPVSRCCSVDGDADRLVYFSPAPPSYGTTGPSISLLDGDKVATLSAVYIRDLMSQLPPEVMDDIQVSCVQTAYSNGAATAYIQEVLKLPTVCTPTGVKYLHKAAHEADVGIYFESNGHGTVLFSRRLIERLQTAEGNPAARELLLLSQLINQTVGDAISGVLLVELILRRKGWTLNDWQALYTDLPSRQVKLQVADRGAITTEDAERVIATPAGLQYEMNKVIALVPQGRAFARPSGTEDVVRVYAEAATQEQADELARRVAELVYDMAGGVGPRP